MGTRGAIGFKVDGKYKVTYNHFDSNPDSLGAEIVAFVTDVVKNGGIETLKVHAKKVRLVKEDQDATVQDIKKYGEFLDLDVGNKKSQNWYCLLRALQGIAGLEAIHAGKVDVMIDSFAFLGDSLFCEYAYIINLDENRIEFYEGFNKSPDKDNPLPIPQTTDGDYYPVHFNGSCPLDAIPTDWQNKFYPGKE